MNEIIAPVIVEQRFRTSVEELWKAITELDQMTQWFFENIPSFRPEVGFQTKFNVKTPERDFMHLWKLTEVEPLKKITYHWTYPDYPGDGYVTFELSEESDQTLLRLTAKGMETFPQDIPEFSRESCIGGWEYFINQRLKDYLDPGIVK